jgi:NAD-dependent dihydropyrimidine dehydrogenase PreA subunit
MAKRIAVVLSQGQSQNPAKRQLEEETITALIMEPGLDVTVIPHLYDLHPDHTGMLALQGISGDMVVVAWLFERATRWTLDRHGIHGLPGMTLLRNQADDEDEDDDEEDEEKPGDRPEEASDAAPSDGKLRVLDARPAPRRRLYCLDWRASPKAEDFVREIRRIAAELNTQVVSLGGLASPSPAPSSAPAPSPSAAALARMEHPINTTALGANGQLELPQTPVLQRIDEQTDRRWYPIIDFSRCTNCMECIDFCLFGVYGVDGSETILVEQPDNCRKGCPACSRVCPENAIIFPQHKSPAIAGSPAAAGALKIDLSRLFGAPDAVEIAAQERDEQLMLAGREAVGLTVGIPKRQADKQEQPKDELDDLIDALDDLDL